LVLKASDYPVKVPRVVFEAPQSDVILFPV